MNDKINPQKGQHARAGLGCLVLLIVGIVRLSAGIVGLVILIVGLTILYSHVFPGEKPAFSDLYGGRGPVKSWAPPTPRPDVEDNLMFVDVERNMVLVLKSEFDHLRGEWVSNIKFFSEGMTLNFLRPERPGQPSVRVSVEAAPDTITWVAPDLQIRRENLPRNVSHEILQRYLQLRDTGNKVVVREIVSEITGIDIP